MHAGDPDHHRTEACRFGEWSFVMSREVVGDRVLASDRYAKDTKVLAASVLSQANKQR